jgi:hypothetical protein
MVDINEKKEALLKKFMKQLELEIIRVEDDSTADTEVLRLVLSNPINAKSSILAENGDFIYMNSNEIFVSNENVDAFFQAVEEKGDKMYYKGALKLDVSKPLGWKNKSGVWELKKPSRIWLTALTFDKLSRTGKDDNRDGLSEFLKEMVQKNKPSNAPASPAAPAIETRRAEPAVK